MPTDRWSDADRELVACFVRALSPSAAPAVIELRVTPEQVADMVLDALTADGWHRKGQCIPVEAAALLEPVPVTGTAYAGEGETPCGEPYPEGGPSCQLRARHDVHVRPASGGFDAWKRETDA